MQKLTQINILVFLLFISGSSCILKKKTTTAAAATTTTTSEDTGTDPLMEKQWHLNNTSAPEYDLNLSTTWAQGNLGNSIIINIVDDGLHINHPDLIANIGTSSYNLNFASSTNSLGANDPSGGHHGTNVAGIISAKDKNNIGVRGIAPRSILIGRNMLAKPTTLSLSQALTKNASEIHISNNSWGFDDDTGELNPRESIWEDAIQTGLTTGRSSLGTIFVWAAGNGGRNNLDNANYDGYANYYGVMAICAVGDDGKKAIYSERGANLWVCGPSLGSSTSKGIVTTDGPGTAGANTASTTSDLTDKDYTQEFSGTSAATPMVSGVAALILKANAKLTWRDVKIIIAQSAQKINPNDPGWSTNSANYNFHHDFGFGLIHADNAVNLAKTWTNVGTLKSQTFTKSITSTDTNASISVLPISDSMSISTSNISKIEAIVVSVDITHDNWGELEIRLEHNSEDASELSDHRSCTSGCSNTLNTWEFLDVRHLGESPQGTWSLKITPTSSSTNHGTFSEWRLTIYGE